MPEVTFTELPSPQNKVEGYFGSDIHIKEIKEKLGDDWFEKLSDGEKLLGLRIAELWEKIVVNNKMPTEDDRREYDEIMNDILPQSVVSETDLLRKNYFGMLKNKATIIYYTNDFYKIKPKNLER